MKFRMILIFIILFSTMFIQLYSRLEESREKCVRRYGGNVQYDEDNDLYHYEKGIYRIIAHYFKNKVDAITYLKPDSLEPSIGYKMSDNEIESILKVNAKDRIWKPTENTSGKRNRMWATEEGDFIAVYKGFDNTLLIVTKEYTARQKLKTKAEEEKLMEGL